MSFIVAHCRSVHRDERGTISILTVIVLLVFTMILGMIINVGREVDDKLKLQNAADAAAYSSAVVVARGMNAVSFSNHLQAEVFAMTAYLREGRDRGSEQVVGPILDAWEKLGPIFERADFPKFKNLGPAITGKVPLEREAVTAFSEMTAVKSKIMLPALEYILGQPESQGSDSSTHLIPEFQRAVVQATPLVAQITMTEIASRHCPGGQGARSQPLSGVFWRAPQSQGVMAVGEQFEDRPYQRTLPLVDPMASGRDAQYLPSADRTTYQTEATRLRRDWSRHYLEAWISDATFDLNPFEREGNSDQYGNFYYHPAKGGQNSAKMSQFSNLYRIFTCGQLEKLLNLEFPTTNLPHVLRSSARPHSATPILSRSRLQSEIYDFSAEREMFEDEFSFVGVVYWPKMSLTFPGMFRSPMPSDSLAFAQANVFLPLPRYHCCPWQRPLFNRFQQPVLNDNGLPVKVPTFTGDPTHWDSFNQNWTVRLAPATHPRLPDILQTQPPSSLVMNARPPDLSGITSQTINSVNTH